MMLKNKEINNVLKNYNIGFIKTKERLTKGYANINYKITTTKGDFLLRICKDKSFQQVSYEIKVMKELKKIRFPTAFPILRTDKKYINKTKLGKIVLYEYIIGEEPKVNTKSTKEIAKAVAKLNSIKNWNKFRKRNNITLRSCNLLITKFTNAKNKYLEIFEYFKEETDFLSKYLKKKVPKGLVHGDIFTDNTKFKKEKLIAILDFEEVCTDNLLFDMGVTINGFCFQDNKLNPNLLKVFLNEYNKIRKISNKERELLPYYIQWGAHVMIYWHLKHLINKREIKKLKRTNYLMKRVKKLRGL